MLDSKPRPVRAASARPADKRPSSGKNHKLSHKTQIVDQLYASNKPVHAPSFMKNKRMGLLEGEVHEISRLIPKSEQMLKDKQELFEENLILKKEMNRMKDQLMKSRTKMEMLTSKNSKYTKQFNREFEKKMYWTGNSNYMVSGVKAQYQKLKEQLVDKHEECESLKRQLFATTVPQLKIYCQTLQQENKKLSQRMSKMSEVSQQLLFENSDKNVPRYLYDELGGKLQKIEEELKESKSEVKFMKNENKEFKKKLQFLEKLLIEKDNSQYHAAKKAKKAEKEKVQLQQKIRNAEGEKQDICRSYQTKLQKLKSLQQKRWRTQKQLFDRTITQKTTTIQKLQKQVAYLSTLLTYWKPLDQLKQEQEMHYNDQDEDDDNDNDEREKKQINPKNKSQERFIMKFNDQDINIKRNVGQDKGGEFVLRPSVDVQGIDRDGDGRKNKIRVQQTADQKNSQNSEKRRKVDFKEVEYLGEHLKYRFLGLRISIDEIRKYFDFNKQASNPEANFVLATQEKQSSTQSSWEQEYITMKQAKQILQNSPFELNEKQSHILARYLIEDSLNEFVYVDPNNENKRSVVKSIIRALVGNYEIFNHERQLQVEQECQDMLSKYQTNLLAALSAMASSGYISRKKFIQFLASLGIEISEAAKDWLICRMLLKSQSLEKLSYMIILE